jgi:hypothetical protein
MSCLVRQTSVVRRGGRLRRGGRRFCLSLGPLDPGIKYDTTFVAIDD